ncbi:hypothetical protein BXZ70DRAFT_354824 [Cristinia sonorae]|uniref:Nucleotidyltransferase n=1 Tax=Cristinia sonorae TaxID=1940300 RepID=A0A8K0UJI6_9AGAR|nr:hypothetical protein BXZ70DRAFT_354824 [Cristinia sonorae]
MPPTLLQIQQVARQVVDLFKNAQLNSCLCGGVACTLYGTTRTPNDVDILVLSTQYHTESLKQYIAGQSSNFFLRDSQKIGATYKILYCRIGSAQECKVDILTPGILNIPHIPTNRLLFSDKLPVMPIIPLLLLKLQTWANHCDSDMPGKRAKVPYDVQDVDQLLGIAISRDDEQMSQAATWLPAAFIQAGRNHAVRYLQESSTSKTANDWRSIGVNL